MHVTDIRDPQLLKNHPRITQSQAREVCAEYWRESEFDDAVESGALKMDVFYSGAYGDVCYVTAELLEWLEAQL